MSYQRILTPRIYVDNINWLLTLGRIDAGDITIVGGSSMASGSSVIEMFDLRPSNIQTISCNGSSTAIGIRIDTNIATDTSQDANFLAILSHNLSTATAKFKIITDDDTNFGSVDTPTMTEVYNASISGGYATPGHAGWSLVTFNYAGTNNNRYVKIEFDDTGSGYGADIQIGAILFGEYLDFPHSPNLDIRKSLIYDGINRQDSVGGSTYSNASFIASPDWVKPPFTTSSNPLRKTGRILYDLNFSYINDTDLFPEKLFNAGDLATSNNIMTNLYQRTLSGHHPFLFQPDKDTATKDDSFLWCRINSEFEATQVSNNVWNTKLSLRETW